MSFRPALVDPQGWSHNWQRGWSHVTGKTSDQLVPCDWQTTASLTTAARIRVPISNHSTNNVGVAAVPRVKSSPTSG
jgi:hypothetical protein